MAESKSMRFTLRNGEVEVRPMHADDAETVAGFARAMAVHDLLFLQRDIRNPRVVAAWIEQIGSGQISSLVATRDGAVIGTSALVRDALSWSPHVAEVRILVGPDTRGTGLGRLLAQLCIEDAAADGVEKLLVKMTPDQFGARRVFEDLGFQPEAILREQVRGAAGATHDIVVFALNVGRWQRQHSLYGMDQAPA